MQLGVVKLSGVIWSHLELSEVIWGCMPEEEWQDMRPDMRKKV